MDIRLAREEDYEEVIALYNIFVGSDRYSKHDNDSFKEVISSPTNFVYLGCENKKIIGFASFSVRAVIRYPRAIAELDELFVLENYRHKGAATKLMEEVETKAKELDCYRLFIESHYERKAAHKFFESLGYTNYGYHFIKNL